MAREGELRTSLVALAGVVALVGLCTFSLKKMLATYAFGVAGIALVLLPDWEFFDRDFSQWFTPMPASRRPPNADSDRPSEAARFKPYPLRVAVLTTIYCFGLYKWWMIVSTIGVHLLSRFFTCFYYFKD